jgi:hypothetical protein
MKKFKILIKKLIKRIKHRIQRKKNRTQGLDQEHNRRSEKIKKIENRCIINN